LSVGRHTQEFHPRLRASVANACAEQLGLLGGAPFTSTGSPLLKLVHGPDDIPGQALVGDWLGELPVKYAEAGLHVGASIASSRPFHIDSKARPALVGHMNHSSRPHSVRSDDTASTAGRARSPGWVAHVSSGQSVHRGLSAEEADIPSGTSPTAWLTHAATRGASGFPCCFPLPTILVAHPGEPSWALERRIMRRWPPRRCRRGASCGLGRPLGAGRRHRATGSTPARPRGVGLPA
jgi:hypothetical protein